MSERNENRPGYKKTKVGWIPEEWEATRLKKLVFIQSGNSPASYVLKSSGKYPFVKVDDMNLSFRYQTQAREYSDSKTGVVPELSIIFAKRGAAIATNKVRIAGVPLLMDSNMMALVPNRDLVVPEFLYYVILNEKLYRIADTSTIPQINNKHINPYRSPFPPLPEQKKIAEILSTWDEAIDQTRKLIEAKKRRKKALMQQLLTGKMRLPEFAKSQNRTSYRFFDLPDDWDCPQMGEIAKECSERNGDVVGHTVLACSKHRGFVESSEYFGKRVFSSDTSNYKVIRRGWFGFPSNHIEEGSIGLLHTHDVGLLSPIYIVFRCADTVVPEFLYALFKTETFRHIFAVSTNASVDRRGSLRWKEFALIRVPLPSRTEQKAISDVLGIADQEIATLEKKLTALEKQKRGLMQKLLTGKVMVKT